MRATAVLRGPSVACPGERNDRRHHPGSVAEHLPGQKQRYGQRQQPESRIRRQR